MKARAFGLSVCASAFAGFADLGYTRDPWHALGTFACGMAVVTVVFAFVILGDGRERAR